METKIKECEQSMTDREKGAAPPARGPARIRAASSKSANGAAAHGAAPVKYRNPMYCDSKCIEKVLPVERSEKTVPQSGCGPRCLLFRKPGAVTFRSVSMEEEQGSS